MPELVGEERIAALEAEIARLRVALGDVRRLVGLELPGAHATQHIVDQALAGDDSALKAMLDAAREEARHQQALESVIPFGELAKQRDAFRAQLSERDATIASLRNRIADNLCYLKPGEALDPMLPKDQHMESCSRFYDQEVGKRGVVAGCMTIAQLEKALAQSEDLFKEAEKSWSALARKFRDERDQLAAQVDRLRIVLGKVDSALESAAFASTGPNRSAIADVLAETPEQSLAAIREQARREALEEVSAHCKSLAESNRKKADRARANRDDLNFERHGCVSDVMFVEEAYWRQLAVQSAKESPATRGADSVSTKTGAKMC